MSVSSLLRGILTLLVVASVAVALISVLQWHAVIQPAQLALGWSYLTSWGVLVAGIAGLILILRWVWLVRAFGALLVVSSSVLMASMWLDYDLNAWVTLTTQPAMTMPTSASIAGVFGVVGLGFFATRRRRKGNPNLGLAVTLGVLLLVFALMAMLSNLSKIQVPYEWWWFSQLPLSLAAVLAVFGWLIVVRNWPQPGVGEVSIRGVRNALVAYVGFGVVLTVMVSAILGLVPIYQQLHAAQNARLEQLGQLRALEIAGYLSKVRGVVTQVASRTRARKMAEAYNYAVLSRDEVAHELRQALGDALLATPDIVGITRLAADGTSLVTLGAAIEEGAWPDAALSVNDITIFGPLRLNGQWRLVVSSPITDEVRTRVATDLLVVDFAPIAQLLARTDNWVAPTQLALGVQTQSNEFMRLPANATPLAQAWAPVADPTLQQALVAVLQSTTETNMQYVDAQQQLIALASVANTRWVVIATADASLLYAVTERQLLLTLGGLLLVAMVGAIGMFFLLRPLTGGILIHTDTLETRVRYATGKLVEQLQERQRAELGLQKTADALVRSNKELEQFAYIASHDLKEPLRSVINFMQLLQRRYGAQLDERANQYIELAVSGGLRMRDLINALLEYSRIGRHNQPLVPVDLNALLDEVVQDLRQSIQESQAKITRDSLPTVVYEPVLLRQVLQNLLSNGLKFRGPAAPVIHVGAQRGQTGWEISITDNGVGIDPAYHQQVFRVFQRLHGRDDYPGAGIGLSVVKKIIEQYGGEVWLTSAVGEGSVFFFTIPDQAEAEPALDAQPSSPTVTDIDDMDAHLQAPKDESAG